MTWRIAMFFSLVVAALCPARGQTADDRLRWKNGDELAGQIVSASTDTLVWNSAVLSQNVTLHLSVLDSISPLTDDETSTDPPESAFRVMLAQGMSLHGELKAITPTHVVIESDRLGEVSLDRRWIDRLQRSGPAGMIDLVGSRGEGWRSVDPRWVYKKPPLADWDVTVPGKVTTLSAGSRLYLPTELPAYCDIELTVESSGRPAFSLALGAIRQLQKRSGNLEVETWGDELVITSPASEQKMTFEHLGQLENDTRNVTLRIFWDRRTGKVTVFSIKAGLLADARMALAPDITTGGLLLENKGADLTVTRLRVNTWDGERGPQNIEGRSRLHTKNGGEYYGTLSGPNEAGEIEIHAGDNVARVAAAEVTEIELAAPPAAPTIAEGNCWLTYDDRTMLRGNLIKIEDGTVMLRTAFSPEPLRCRLMGLKRCEFKNLTDTSRFASEHVLEYAGLQLRGTLGAAETSLGWRLVGAANTIPLKLTEPLTIRRVESSGDGPTVTDANGDIVLMKSGDLLPCRVESIDADVVAISTDFSAPARIPQDDVQAVSLSTAQVKQINGFLDDNWQINGKEPAELERRPEEIVFHDSANVSHPTLMAGGNLEFDVDWNRQGQSYLMLTLTTQQIIQRNAPARGIVIGPNRQMFYLNFNQNRVMAYVLEGNAFRAVHAQQMIQSGDPIHVRIRRVDDNVTLWVNDQEQGSLQVSGEQAGNMGVMFQTQTLRNANGQRGGDLDMTISNLRAGRGDGLFFHLPIMKSAKAHVVTVPRMRRDRPPSHVLVGQNGDLLRGKLLALGPTSAQFESRLNDVIIPRDRLSGIVWLTAPPKESDEEVAPPAEKQQPVPEPDASDESEGLVQATFGNGVVLTFSPEQVEGDELVARHRVFGECRLSLASIAELRVGPAGNRSDPTDEPPTFTEWTLIHAPEPVIPGANGGFGTYSELVGQPAEDFTLPLLGGGMIRLSDLRGKIVVLDFWATWCGPCIQAMPQIMAATEAFPGDVVFVAVNQEENPEVIKAFLEARAWDLTVAVDRRGDVGRQFRVQGIPQTVIVGRSGNIEHVHLGSSPDMEDSLKGVLESLVLESLLNDSPQSSGE